MVCLSSIADSPINTRTLVEKSFYSALVFLSINQRVKYQPSNSGDCARNQYSSFLRKRLCKKPSLGRAGGKPNPLNPPYQGDFPLNSPLIRGARGLGKTNIGFLHSLESRNPVKHSNPQGFSACNACLARVSCAVSKVPLLVQCDCQKCGYIN